MKKLTTLFATLLYSTAAFSQAGGVYTGPNQPGQVIGTGAADNALVGNVGETITSQVVFGSAVSLTNGVPANLTSISLTPGDWETSCEVIFIPAATTAIVTVAASLNTVSAANNSNPGSVGQLSLSSTGATVGANNLTVIAGPHRVSTNVPLTEFCVLYSLFGTSTLSAYGQQRARRVR